MSSRAAASTRRPRVYLLGADGKYVMMSLLNQELSVDVDLSSLPCGENGAFYLSEMAADGKTGAGGGAMATATPNAGDTAAMSLTFVRPRRAFLHKAPPPSPPPPTLGDRCPVLTGTSGGQLDGDGHDRAPVQGQYVRQRRLRL